MSLKRFPENDYHQFQNSYQEATQSGDFTSIPELIPDKQSAMNYTAPAQLPPRRGRIFAFVLVTGILGTIAYNFWNSYLRYDSFGVVDADYVRVYPPTAGFIQNLQVKEGAPIVKGDLLAVIADQNDLRQIAKLNDEIKMAQSEIPVKKEENELRNTEKLNAYYLNREQTERLKTEIQELKSQLQFQKTEMARFIALKKQNSSSAKELDETKFNVLSISTQIQGKEQTLSVLKLRETLLKNLVDSLGQESLNPIKFKLEYLVNEKSRLVEKINEGRIYSPVTGVISSHEKSQSERVELTDSIVSIIVNDTSQLVLYYDPADQIPPLNSEIEVLSPSLNKMVKAKVVALSKEVVDPPNQIKRYFSANQKLVKVYLDPIDVDINSFVIGSIVKRPNPSEKLTSLWKKTFE